MCGISGVWCFGRAATEADVDVARMMARQLAHRGPDDYGEWCDPTHGVVLTHRRLSILDLSVAGHQPMTSPAGRWVIVYNGEIYNHQALRRELEQTGRAPNWQGHSDTETILASFDVWGIQATLKKAVGMFAFAAWDRKTATLTLGRDRLGEKPLYYGWRGGIFLFGSELKALRAHPTPSLEVDREALVLFLRHRYVPAPRSIYRGIAKLPAGTLLYLRQGQFHAEPVPYWTAEEWVAAGISDRFAGSDEEAIDTLESLLGDAVAGQMISDVPLGAFLSGGVDLSLIVALMQARSSRPVKTYTIGFQESAYNEAVYAKAVASHLATDHTEVYVSPRDALDVIPRLPHIYDEPFADASQIPTFLLSQLARQHVTVTLSGDGGDELFGGYDRYLEAHRTWPIAGRIPLGVRQLAARGVAELPPRTLEAMVRPFRGSCRLRCRGSRASGCKGWPPCWRTPISTHSIEP